MAAGRDLSPDDRPQAIWVGTGGAAGDRILHKCGHCRGTGRTAEGSVDPGTGKGDVDPWATCRGPSETNCCQAARAWCRNTDDGADGNLVGHVSCLDSIVGSSLEPAARPSAVRRL